VIAKNRVRLGLVLAVGILLGFIYLWSLGDRNPLSIAMFAKYEQGLRELETEHPILCGMAAFLIYVAVTGLSLPGAAVLTVFCGWLFGFVPACVLCSFASTSGATIAMLSSRYFFRDGIESQGATVKKILSAVEAEGASVLFFLRLSPIVPFFVINAAMGLTRMKTRTFWWVSQIGMLPGTLVFVLAGSSLPSISQLQRDGLRSLISPQLVLGFLAIGLLPIVIRFLMRSRYRKWKNESMISQQPE
jgi:uncharacterized membrane protein YdjX (TVP38/TMEM64 family)